MKSGRRVDRILPWHYVLSDAISAAIAWAMLFIHRKVEMEEEFLVLYDWRLAGV